MKLIADIGGTKTLFAISNDGATLAPQRLENDQFDTFDAALEHYLHGLPSTARKRLSGAVFAVASPIVDSEARLTNRQHWRVRAPSLAALVGGTVELVNDFVAAAQGIELLEASALVTLQAGQTVPTTLRLCLGPGTGFGVASLANGQAQASEGGHIAFAPRDAEQADLWRFLGGEHRRLTIERLCSGAGLLALYRFALVRSGHALPQDLLPEEVVVRARDVNDPDARHALGMFIDILGAAAGDLALAFLARGGVYIAGGIAAKLLPELQDGRLLRAFNDKAEHQPLTQAMPVHVVVREDLSLLGAAAIAGS